MKTRTDPTWISSSPSLHWSALTPPGTSDGHPPTVMEGGVMSNTVDHIWITYIPKMLLRISLQLMSSMQFYLWVINSSESSLSWSYLETKSPSFTSSGQLLTEPQTQPVNFQVGYFYGRLDKLNRSDTDSFKFTVFYWRPKEICEWFLVLGHKLLECKPYPQETDI